MAHLRLDEPQACVDRVNTRFRISVVYLLVDEVMALVDALRMIKGASARGGGGTYLVSQMDRFTQK